MNITVKQCDFCKADIRNDDPKYRHFSVLETPGAYHEDVCPDCVKALRAKNAGTK